MSNRITNLARRISNKVLGTLEGYEISPFITPIQFQKDVRSSNPRLNLFIPNIEKSMMYGGQKTAYNFFASVLEQFDGDARIFTEHSYSDEDLARIRNQYPDWAIVSANEQSKASKQIVVLAPEVRASSCLPLRALDYFIVTYWTGAYALSGYRDFQLQEYGHATPHIHLIQDYEPAFNAWSTDYLLADSVYHQPDTIAVFNSVELEEWFKELNYSFQHNFSFSPKLDSDIAKHLHENTGISREKYLIFYGRPNIPRNCFSLVLAAINTVLTQHPEVSKEWKILSIGSDIGKITLADSQQLQSPGKMTLDDYAALMHKASVGVSLMCSPHPSYPPLEMAAFGVQTITNSFGPKNLGDIPNITSLDSISVQGLADEIWNKMRAFTPQTPNSKPWPKRYEHYFEYTDFFDGIIPSVANILNNDIQEYMRS